jgi:predicted transcriptional regulator
MESLIRKKPVNLFLAIDINKSKNVQRLSRSVDVTYSHANKLIDKWIKDKLLTKTKNGRENLIEYTERGYKIKEGLFKLIQEFGGKK